MIEIVEDKEISSLALFMELPQVAVVNEGHVIRRMPVKTVAVHVKWNSVQQSIDRLNHLHRLSLCKQNLS